MSNTFSEECCKVTIVKLLQHIISPIHSIPWECEFFYPEDVWDAFYKEEFARVPYILPDNDVYRRDYNIRRIAYLMKNPSTVPISIDVGCPSLGYFADDYIVDGWHRIYAAILREDTYINAQFSGEAATIQELFDPICEQTDCE